MADLQADNSLPSVLKRSIPPRIVEAASTVSQQPGRSMWSAADQAASEIQAVCRGRIARRKTKKLKKKKVNAAVTIQAQQRGRATRKRTAKQRKRTAVHKNENERTCAHAHRGPAAAKAKQDKPKASDKPRWGVTGSHTSVMHMRAPGMEAKEDEDVPGTSSASSHEQTVIQYGHGGAQATKAQVSAWALSGGQGGRGAWRSLASYHRKEIARRAELLRGVAIFSKFKTGQLRKLAVRMQRLECAHGDLIFAEDQIGDSMFIVDEGSCAVLCDDKDGALAIDVESSMPKGAVFGHLSLLTRERREASVVACSEPTALLRLSTEAAQKLLTEVIGGPDELQTRVDLLAGVEAFQDYTTGELLQLAAVAEKVVYDVGDTIVEQGKRGWHLYIVWEGNLTVNVDKVGRVNELTAGEMFGEAALMTPVSYRSATVSAVGPVVLLKLAQSDWRRALRDERCLEVMSKAVVQNDIRDNLRASPLIGASMRKFYDLVVKESARLEMEQAQNSMSPTHARWKRLRIKTKGTRISRDAYASLHVRIAKILDADFDPDKAVLQAHKEWADDLAAFSGKRAVHVWLEEIKLTLREATQAVVYKTGWSSIFEEADENGSGELDVLEFTQAARDVMSVPPETLSDKDLQLLFTVADGSNDKVVSADEFSAFISQSPDTVQLSGQMSNAMQVHTDMLTFNVKSTLTVLQSASHLTAVERGWSKLFESYDRDGEGSLDLSEFAAIIREDCGIDENILPDEKLSELFRAVDTDGEGTIDAFEFKNFLISDPLISQMTFEVFSEAIFQMAVYWSAEVQYDDEFSDEEQYVAFLESLYDRLTVEQPALHLKEGRERHLAPLGTLKCALDTEGMLPWRTGAAHLGLGLTRRSQTTGPQRDDHGGENAIVSGDAGIWRSGVAHHGENRFLSGATSAEVAQTFSGDPWRAGHANPKPILQWSVVGPDRDAEGAQTITQGAWRGAGVANPTPALHWGVVGPDRDFIEPKHPLQDERSKKGTIPSYPPVDFAHVASKVFVQEHQVVPMVHVEGEKRRVEPNPNLIGSWRDSRLIAARTDVAAKPNTPRLPDWAAAPWKATSPPKGRSKVMSPRPPQTRRKQPGRRKEGGAKWVVEGRRKDEAGGDAAPRKIKPEHLHPATEQAIKASLTRAIAHRMTLYGHKVTDLESFFKAVDIDQSGGIDTEELHSAFKRLDAGFSNRQLDSLLITIGMNDDGLVSFSELKAWMERKASSFTPVGMQHGQGLELPAEPVAKEVLPDVGFESCMLPEVLRHRIRAPIRPAAVKPSDWHSPRASLTKHMGSHPKTPFNRLASGDNLRPVLTDGFADDLRAQDAIQQQQALIAASVRQIRSTSSARFWEMDTAPERTRRVQIQRKINDASKRRAMTQRLPRLGLHNDAVQESPLVAKSAPYRGQRGSVRHAEISAIVAGTGSGVHVPKTPLVLREPMTVRRQAKDLRARPITVRTMCAALTDGL